MAKLNEDVLVEVHGKKYLSVKYTNMADQVEATIAKLEELLDDKHDKIVGLDVEYTSPYDGPEQKAAVIQLYVDYRILVFHIRHADRHCQVLTDFLANPAYTFAGVGIGYDEVMLRRVHLKVKNFVDIQTKWRVPYKQGTSLDGLDDYAASVIDSSYSRRIKEGFDPKKDHCRWEDKPLPEKNLRCAAMDAYATFQQLVAYARGMQGLNISNLLLVKGSGSKRKLSERN